MTRLSYSQVARIAECPWRWYLERHLKFRSLPTWAMVAGTAVHKATEALDREASGHDPEGPTDFCDAFDEAITAEEERSGFSREEWKVTGRRTRTAPRGKDYDWWTSEGIIQVHKWKKWALNAAVDLWGIEVPWQIDRGGVGAKGMADRVYKVRGQDYYLVVDIKTGKTPFTAQQLGDYADALARAYNLRVDYGAYWLGSTGHLGDVHCLGPWVGRRTECLYRNAARIIENRAFLPSPGIQCSYCPMRENCFVCSSRDDVPTLETIEEEECPKTAA